MALGGEVLCVFEDLCQLFDQLDLPILRGFPGQEQSMHAIIASEASIDDKLFEGFLERFRKLLKSSKGRI